MRSPFMLNLGSSISFLLLGITIGNELKDGNYVLVAVLIVLVLFVAWRSSKEAN